MYTGYGNLSRLGDFVMWQGFDQRLNDTWAGCSADTNASAEYNNDANTFTGTEAFFFAPNVPEGGTLHVRAIAYSLAFPRIHAHACIPVLIKVYTEDLLRSGDLLHTSTVDLGGVQLYRFTLDPSAL